MAPATKGMFASSHSFIGFGTWGIDHDQLEPLIHEGLKVGYEHFDTASIYENEGIVGRALSGSGKLRSNYKITTKVSRDDIESFAVFDAARTSRDRLRVEKVDLILAHWPPTSRSLKSCVEDLIEIKEAGIADHVGVSNFTYAQLNGLPEDILSQIYCVQAEYHPHLAQTKLQEFCCNRKKRFVAYSPLGRGSIFYNVVLKNIGIKYNKTVPQIVLRWHFQSSRAVVVRSTRAAAIKENINIFDFELNSGDMEAIEALTTVKSRIVSPTWAPDWDK